MLSPDRNSAEFINYQQVRGILAFRGFLAYRLFRLDLNKTTSNEYFISLAH